MTYLERIRACNLWDPNDFVPWTLNGQVLGRLRRERVGLLDAWPDQFAMAEDRVDWHGAPAGFEDRSAVLDEVVGALVDQGELPHRHGERYGVSPSTRDRAVCLLDRAAVPWFGVRACGQHLNGYVRTDDGLALWIGRRSIHKRHAPGQLDNFVAGGLPHGVPLEDNLLKECREEADCPPALAGQALPVGAITYCRHGAGLGLKPDIIYCYDLALPASFVPRCNDGEVASFQLIPLPEVARLLREAPDFKLNSALVAIDFMVRHGLLEPDEPDYAEIVQGLHTALP